MGGKEKERLVNKRRALVKNYRGGGTFMNRPRGDSVKIYSEKPVTIKGAKVKIGVVQLFN